MHMNTMDALLADALQHTLILDRMNDRTERDALYSFALDELLCRRTGQGGPPICHIWRHSRAFIMGLRDSRLPRAEDGRRWLESQGWNTAVRHSGGAAVPLDDGVVNLSLILPIDTKAGGDYKLDFERMYRFISEALSGISEVTVDKGEIAGAYCPGDYDLSINGFKFCGIAQRRQTHAYIVQAFVVAEGSGARRARLVRDFYRIAAEGADPGQFPVVVPDSTRSLEELANLGERSAEAFAHAIKATIRKRQHMQSMDEAYSRLDMPPEAEILDMVQSLRSRYTIGQQ